MVKKKTIKLRHHYQSINLDDSNMNIPPRSINPRKSKSLSKTLRGVPCCSPFVSNEGVVSQNCEFRIPMDKRTMNQHFKTFDDEKFQVINEVNSGDLNYFQVIDNRSYVTV
jgi:hypothetical protein